MPGIIGSRSICKIEEKPVVEGVVVTAVDRLFADDSVDGFDEVVAVNLQQLNLLQLLRQSHQPNHLQKVYPQP